VISKSNRKTNVLDISDSSALNNLVERRRGIEKE
jgi:hypothetical protein